MHVTFPPYVMVLCCNETSKITIFPIGTLFVFRQIRDSRGTTVIKYIHVDVTCHITMDTTNETRKAEPQVMRVSGTAVVSRGHAQPTAQLVRIENIGLSSQLNLLFVIQQAKLVFHPL